MQVTVLKSKILRAKVTESKLDYQGSLGIDSAWMEEVGFLPYEKILVGNLNNGDRFETSYHLSENAPHIQLRTFLRVKLRIEPSITPHALLVLIKTGSSVMKSF